MHIWNFELLGGSFLEIAARDLPIFKTASAVDVANKKIVLMLHKKWCPTGSFFP